ncbi:hypothetical protein OE88DRAFT_1649560 [Heliocybe sulcata]|uniref:Uncharacterized protein n=1 Tax=Heliocybe sulcata TaxID=5364 RepID=A0A5C3NG74_9AGAM|nr:hypothetical protein OE88DRAFT_1649560 [Heliocybe sulcata]
MDGRRETLEVEDEDAREMRINELLQKTNASAGEKTVAADVQSLLGGPSDRPHALEPPSELLSRVQAFIPQLAASNADLESRMRQDPGSVDIENVSQDAGQYIEMNLGLGVFEARGDQTQTRRSSSSSSMSMLSSLSGSTSAPDSSSDDDSDSESACSEGRRRGPQMRRPIRPLPRRAIVEVNGSRSPRASSVPPQ